jgi:ubiquinone/menaquinone biosynthesis C-methylase UbiE
VRLTLDVGRQKGGVIMVDELSVQSHYRAVGLLDRIVAGLRDAGKDPGAPTIDDLAPADEFHSAGRHATKDLAALAILKPGTRVLDVGSGLGGPARFLAATYGCSVTGIDLMPEFCAVANELSRLTRLANRTQFRHGNALALPFDDGEFDCVWTIQTQMNIAEKRQFYGEITRVLQPGGQFVFQDICEGNGQPLDFPVPWASEAGQSHLISPEDLRMLLNALGLKEHTFRDVSASILAWLDANRPPAGTLPPLGMHLVLGERHAEKRANSGRALRDGRVTYVQGVFLKPE